MEKCFRCQDEAEWQVFMGDHDKGEFVCDKHIVDSIHQKAGCNYIYGKQHFLKSSIPSDLRLEKCCEEEKKSFMVSLQVHTADSALRSNKPVEWDFMPFIGLELEIEKVWEEKIDGLKFTTKTDGREVETVTIKRIVYKSLQKFFHVEAVTFHGEKSYGKMFEEENLNE